MSPSRDRPRTSASPLSNRRASTQTPTSQAATTTGRNASTRSRHPSRTVVVTAAVAAIA